MTSSYDKYDKMMRAEADGMDRNTNRGRYYMNYQCPRCKCPLEPDDTDCMVCGYIMRKPKETYGKH